MIQKSQELKDFSFIEDELPVYKQLLIKLIEQITGKRKVSKIYRQIVAKDDTGRSFWDRAVEELELQIRIHGNSLNSIPKQGPLLVVANHPFGQIDGLVLGYILEKIRPDFKIVAWDIMNEIDYFKDKILPISFKNEYSSKRNNLRTLKQSIQNIKEGGVVAIFPSGECAISKNFIGKAQEGQWLKFTSRIVLATDVPVLPIFFHGQNSRIFQIIGNLGYYFKLSMFFHEICNMIGKDVRLTIGNLLNETDYSNRNNEDDLIDYLFYETEKLSFQNSL
jgi:putative hemolysin